MAQPGEKMCAQLAVAGGCIAMLVTLAVAGAPARAETVAAPAAKPEALAGITVPHQTVTLAPIPPGRIAAITADQGEPVRKNQVVVALDANTQRIVTEIAKAEADSTLEIELAQANLDWAQRELQRLTDLNAKASVARKELRDAKLAADQATLAHEIAVFRHAQACRRYEREKLKLAEHELIAPFDGYVAEIKRRVGATVDEREGVVVLAQLDPLDVLIDCPLSAARQVHVNDEVTVEPVDPQWPPRRGKIVMACPVADPGSQTFRVKILVPNSDRGWVSGLKVQVNFQPPAIAARP